MTAHSIAFHQKVSNIMAYWELQDQMLRKMQSEIAGAAIVLQNQMSSIEAVRSGMGPGNEIIRAVDVAWQQRACNTITHLTAQLENLHMRVKNLR